MDLQTFYGFFVGWFANRKWKKKSGTTIPSRQNYRVILHNFQAWPRAAWVGASCSKWSLPARFTSCTLSWSNLSCVQCYRAASGWEQKSDLRNFRPLFSLSPPPTGLIFNLCFFSSGTFLRDYAIVFARILPCLICPTSNLILVLFSFFHNSISEWSSLCPYNYFLLT